MRAFLAAYQSFEPDLAAFDLTRVTRCSTSDSRATFFADLAGKPYESLSQDEIDALRSQVKQRFATSIDANIVVKTHVRIFVVELLRNSMPSRTPSRGATRPHLASAHCVRGLTGTRQRRLIRA